MSDEGSIKFECRWHYAPAPTYAVVPKLLETRNRLHDLGLVGALPDGIGYGNVSARLDAGSFVITGSGTGSVRRISAEHLTLVTAVDFETNRVENAGPVHASSESMTHAAVYRAHRDITSVIHVHSSEIWSRLSGRVPTTRSAAPYGTPAMAEEIARLFRGQRLPCHGIVVMGGHVDGIITFGRTFDEAMGYLPGGGSGVENFRSL